MMQFQPKYQKDFVRNLIFIGNSHGLRIPKTLGKKNMKGGTLIARRQDLL